MGYEDDLKQNLQSANDDLNEKYPHLNDAPSEKEKTLDEQLGIPVWYIGVNPPVPLRWCSDCEGWHEQKQHFR